MGKHMESWIPQLQPHMQSYKAESLNLPFDIGIPFTMPFIDSAPPCHALPASAYSSLYIFGQGQSKEPHSCFYVSPHAIPNMIHHEDLLPKMNLLRSFSTAAVNAPIATAELAPPKQFLVFDHTDNKTTMMCSSEVGAQTQWLSSRSPMPARCSTLGRGEHEIGNDGRHCSGPPLTNEFDDDDVTSDATEMYEDTDEIDALLYSDDQGKYSDEAEETSTGHSPCSMTAHENEYWLDEQDADEVASSAGTPGKRQKLSGSSSEVPTVTNAASSVTPNRSFDYEDDAESSCVGRPVETLSGNKRLRNEKIRETVSILQTIIPNGKGKDAVVVLDEAIGHLRTLKFRAKTLGLSAM